MSSRSTRSAPMASSSSSPSRPTAAWCATCRRQTSSASTIVRTSQVTVISRYLVIRPRVRRGGRCAARRGRGRGDGSRGLGRRSGGVQARRTRPSLKPIAYLGFLVTAVSIAVVLIIRQVLTGAGTSIGRIAAWLSRDVPSPAFAQHDTWRSAPRVRLELAVRLAGVPQRQHPGAPVPRLPGRRVAELVHGSPAARQLGRGRLTVHGMFSLRAVDGARATDRRRCSRPARRTHGAALVDYQHPHDLVMDSERTLRLAARTRMASCTSTADRSMRPRSGRRSSCIVRPRTRIRRRRSAHHMLDSTHITHGVITDRALRADRFSSRRRRFTAASRTRIASRSSSGRSTAIRRDLILARGRWQAQVSAATREVSGQDRVQRSRDDHRVGVVTRVNGSAVLSR